MRVIGSKIGDPIDSGVVGEMKAAMYDVVLQSLSRRGFFEQALLWGYTAAHFGYHAPLCADPLQFRLRRQQADFDPAPYLVRLESDFDSFGLDVEISMKRKTGMPVLETFMHSPPLLVVKLLVRDAADMNISLSIDTQSSPEFPVMSSPGYASCPYACIPLPVFFAWNISELLFGFPKKRRLAYAWFYFEWCIERGVPIDTDCLCRLISPWKNASYPDTVDRALRLWLMQRASRIDVSSLIAEMHMISGGSIVPAHWSSRYFQRLVQSMEFSPA